MRKDKDIATNLPREGKSYGEIRETLGISKATLSDWFSQKDWSIKIRKNLSEKLIKTSTERLIKLDRIRGENLDRLYGEARVEALCEFENFKTNPLFLGALFLYWGEGDKVNMYQVRISNSDPAIIKIFLSFLKNICNVPTERVRLGIIGYADTNIPVSEDFWSGKVALSKDNFHKTVIIKSRSKVKKLPHGTAVAGVSSVRAK